MRTNRPGPRPARTAGRALVLAWGLVAAACGGGPGPPGPRLVVLYSTCTLSKEFLGPWSGVEYTPNLDRFAKGALVFERHETESGQSGVAFASLYTGTQADRHGVYHHPTTLSDELFCVGEAFRDAGYETHFWSGQSLASADLGYGQGIDDERVYRTYVMFTKHAKELGEDFFVSATATGPELDAVLEALRDDPSRSAFLQINFTITHELYHEYADVEKIEAFRARYPRRAGDWSRAEIVETLAFFEEHRHLLQLDHSRAVRELGLSRADVARIDGVLRLAYMACVEQLDRHFGVFVEKVDAAGLLEDSLIAFTADHGETFRVEGEAMHWMHGLQLAPTVLSVPFVLHGPSAGVVPGRYAEVTRSIDVFPTLAGLAGIELPIDGGPDGADLSAAVRGERAPPRLLAFSHTSTLGADRIQRYRRNGYATVLSILPEPDPSLVRVRVRDGDRVWEVRPTPRVGGGEPRTLSFDLAADPERTNDLFDPTDPVDAQMAERLVRYRQRLVRGFAPTEGMSQRETLRLLQGLGYVGDE